VHSSSWVLAVSKYHEEPHRYCSSASAQRGEPSDVPGAEGRAGAAAHPRAVPHQDAERERCGPRRRAPGFAPQPSPTPGSGVCSAAIPDAGLRGLLRSHPRRQAPGFAPQPSPTPGSRVCSAAIPDAGLQGLLRSHPRRRAPGFAPQPSPTPGSGVCSAAIRPHLTRSTSRAGAGMMGLQPPRPRTEVPGRWKRAALSLVQRLASRVNLHRLLRLPNPTFPHRPGLDPPASASQPARALHQKWWLTKTLLISSSRFLLFSAPLRALLPKHNILIENVNKWQAMVKKANKQKPGKKDWELQCSSGCLRGCLGSSGPGLAFLWKRDKETPEYTQKPGDGHWAAFAERPRSRWRGRKEGGWVPSWLPRRPPAPWTRGCCWVSAILCFSLQCSFSLQLDTHCAWAETVL